MNDERPVPAEPRQAPASGIDETARRIRAWASGARALAFRPVDQAEGPHPDMPSDLFRSIDAAHVGRELREKKITMVGVEPGDVGILIATEKRLATKTQPSATTNGIPLRFVKAGRPTTSLPCAAIEPSPHQGMIGGLYTCGSSISPLTRNTTGTLG